MERNEHQSASDNLDALNNLLQKLIALAMSLVFTSLSYIGLSLRFIIKGKAIHSKEGVTLFNGKKIRLLNSSNWLIQHSVLFPQVFFGNIKLVGTYLSEYSLSASSESTITDGSKVNYQNEKSAGIFSLYFIRQSSRIAHKGISAIDQEYLDKSGFKTDFSILLQSVPAILYHHGEEVTSPTIDIFGIQMLNLTMQEAINLIDDKVREREKCPLFFVNPDCLNKVFVDRDYYRILKANRVVFPDGIGIHIAGKMLKNPLKENVNGTDMLPHLCELAVLRGYKIYLLGAAPGVAETMKVKLMDKYKGLSICGTRDGFFDWSNEVEAVIDGINSAGTDILLVAFGAPRQENFISQFGQQITAPVMMGVGGLFDFYSDRIARAPIWMRQTGLEWVFRLIQEPKRMWKRYIIGNPVFLYRVFRWKRNKNFYYFG